MLHHHLLQTEAVRDDDSIKWTAMETNRKALGMVPSLPTMNHEEG